MIITKDEWLAMRRKWLANCDAWLAQHDPLTRTLNPYIYTTLSDGRHHPCEAPDITSRHLRSPEPRPGIHHACSKTE